MTTLMMYVNLILFIFALADIIYGIVKIANKNMPFYCIAVFCAWICLALARLYLFLDLLIDGANPNEFNLSWFAFLACFVFLFSANYGCLDEKASEEAKGTKKERLIALAAPLCIAVLYGVNMYEYHKLGIKLSTIYIVFCSLLSLLIVQTTYYNLKNLIIKSEKGSTLYKLKGFNAVMLIFSFLTMVEITAPISQSKVVFVIAYLLIGFTTLAVMPVLKRGNIKNA